MTSQQKKYFYPEIAPLILDENQKKRLRLTKFYDEKTSEEEKKQILKMIGSTTSYSMAPTTMTVMPVASTNPILQSQIEENQAEKMLEQFEYELEHPRSIKPVPSQSWVHLLNKFNELYDSQMKLLQDIQSIYLKWNEVERSMSELNALPITEERNREYNKTVLLGTTIWNQMQVIDSVLNQFYGEDGLGPENVSPNVKKKIFEINLVYIKRLQYVTGNYKIKPLSTLCHAVDDMFYNIRTKHDINQSITKFWQHILRECGGLEIYDHYEEYIKNLKLIPTVEHLEVIDILLMQQLDANGFIYMLEKYHPSFIDLTNVQNIGSLELCLIKTIIETSTPRYQHIIFDIWTERYKLDKKEIEEENRILNLVLHLTERIGQKKEVVVEKDWLQRLPNGNKRILF